jgi:hypothetical protein
VILDIRINSIFRYLGEVRRNMLDGAGEFRWSNGDHYTGHYSKGKRSGIGRMLFDNGNVYNGQWKSGLYHGKGTFKYSFCLNYLGFSWKINKQIL